MNKTRSFVKIISLIMALLMLSSVIILPASAASAPAAPEKLVSSTTTTEIKLSWSKVSGATGYRIYYKFPRDLHWKTALSSTTATNKTWKNLPSGETYIFAVRSYTKTNSGVTWGGYKELETATKPLAPKRLTSSQNTSTIKLNWSEVKGADGYRIYYRATSSKNWNIAVSDTDDTTHTFTGLSSAKKYDLAVRPYIKTSSGIIWGDYKEIGTATKPEPPSNLQAYSDYNKKTITLKWNKVTRADGYRIYYKKAYADTAWKLIVNSTTSTNYTFKNVPYDTTYSFAVRPYINTKFGNIFADYRVVSMNIYTPSTATTAPSTIWTTAFTTMPTTTMPRTTTMPNTTTNPATSTQPIHRNKIDIYLETFKSGNFLIEANDTEIGHIKMAIKGNKMYVDSINGDTTLKLLFNGDKKDKDNPDGSWYVLIDKLNKYSKIPSEDLKNIKEKDVYKQLFQNTYDIINTDIADINGSLFVYETAIDDKNNKYDYYFDGDVLVKFRYTSCENAVSEIDFSKITTEVPDTLFAIPSDYDYLNLEWLLKLAGASGNSTPNIALNDTIDFDSIKELSSLAISMKNV